MKNTIKLAAMLFIAWLWLPTGPSDFLIIPLVISIIGRTGYIIISIAMIVFLYKFIEGKTLNDKLKNVKKEIKKI